MFENMSFEKIMENLLSKVPENMDKREGSIIWDALAPCAVSMSVMYASLDEVINESFADTASRPYLIKRAAERGLAPYEATHAVLKAEIFPKSCVIRLGERFSCGDVFFTVSEKISEGFYKIKSEIPGDKGNIPTGDLHPVNYIEGFNYAKISGILIPANDSENTEDFRQRYFDSFEKIPFGGNISDYISKVKSMDGVGAVKIIPHWNGGGTVKVIFLDSLFNTPVKEHTEKIQQKIDPPENSGLGYGTAPIGHIVTVEGAKPVKINISAEFILKPHADFESVRSEFEKAIENYLLSIRKNWESGKNQTVRITAVEYAVLSCDHILDIRNTKINGKTENLILNIDEIPVKGALTNEK